MSKEIHHLMDKMQQINEVKDKIQKLTIINEKLQEDTSLHAVKFNKFNLDSILGSSFNNFLRSEKIATMIS